MLVKIFDGAQYSKLMHALLYKSITQSTSKSQADLEVAGISDLEVLALISIKEAGYSLPNDTMPFDGAVSTFARVYGPDENGIIRVIEPPVELAMHVLVEEEQRKLGGQVVQVQHNVLVVAFSEQPVYVMPGAVVQQGVVSINVSPVLSDLFGGALTWLVIRVLPAEVFGFCVRFPNTVLILPPKSTIH